MSIIMPTDKGIEAVDVGKVEFSKNRHIFKAAINFDNKNIGKQQIEKIINFISEKYSKNILIPIEKITKQNIYIKKINSKFGNSDFNIYFNLPKTNIYPQCYVVGTIKKQLETIQFLIDLQTISNNHFIFNMDDNKFSGNTGFGITSQGLYPLIGLSDTIKNEMKRFISFEQYKNNNNIINDYIKEITDLLSNEYKRYL